MNRKKRRDFNKSMKSKTAADEMIDMNESIVK